MPDTQPRSQTLKRFTEYIKASYAELRKVTWPNRRTTIRLTGLVIAFSLVFAAFLGGLDSLFALIVQKVILKG